MESLFFIVRMIPTALMITAPVLIAAAGGLVCERSGVVNIALEGLMLFGAMTAAIVHVLLESSAFFSIPAALFFAALAGGLFSLVHAFASVTLNADQIISGTGINLLSGGITVFVCQILFRMDRTPHYKMGMRSGLFGIYPTIWIALLIFALVWFFLYKHSFGFRLRAAGENPKALECAGVSVKKIQYAAVLISGLLAGLAGGCIVLTQNIQFTANTINGKGFIALAAVAFGSRVSRDVKMPFGILGASFLFGISLNLAIGFVNIKLLKFLPSEIFNMMPFLITLLALIILGNKKKSG